jgi:class 3 adenylate cyclase
MSDGGGPYDALSRMLEVGLVQDLDSETGQRIHRAREAARAIGIDERAAADLLQAYARAVGRIVAAEREIVARAVPAEPLASRGRRMHEWAQASLGLAVEIFDSLHAELLFQGLDDVGSLDGEAGERTVAFVDLCGSAAFMLGCSAEELRALVDELFFCAQSVASAHGATVVKYLGDGVVMLAEQPQIVLAATVELVEQLAVRTPLPAGGGVAHGRVLAHAGDLIGPAMNLANRLSELARANEVLVDIEGWPLPGLGGSPRLVAPRGLERELPVHAIVVP